MSRQRKIARALGAAVLLTHSFVAHALFTAPETEAFDLSLKDLTFTVVDGKTPGTNTGPKSTQALLTFDKFDTGLGTLLGVELTFRTTYGSTTTVSVTGTPTDSFFPGVTFTAIGSQALTLTGGALNEVLNQLPSASCQTSVDSCQNSAFFGPSNFDSAAPISLAPLADFLGPGTFILTATLASSINPWLSGAIRDAADNSTMTGTLATDWRGSVGVRYQYQERSTGGTVPEPMTLYLLVGGAVGIAFLRRRSRLAGASPLPR